MLAFAVALVPALAAGVATAVLAPPVVDGASGAVPVGVASAVDMVDG